MCVFCKVLLIPNFNFLREKYGDTLFGIKKTPNLTQTKKCQGRQLRGAQIFPGGEAPLAPPVATGLGSSACDATFLAMTYTKTNSKWVLD